ncbi:hypothetical protein FJTKL_04393 [Diaporthe vaccinii]|uniref:Uncharacterized protein n=1 Tax=Diaporthe vaccinii TaxID=105482 RepID=A0ABR4F1F3_9PEZI
MQRRTGSPAAADQTTFLLLGADVIHVSSGRPHCTQHHFAVASLYSRHNIPDLPSTSSDLESLSISPS